MKGSGLNDSKRLQAKLSRLIALSRDSAANLRVLKASKQQSMAGLILNEVNETVLPRRLYFERDNGTAIGFDVSGRRIYSVIKSDGTPHQTEPDAGPEGLAAIAAAELATFARDAHETTVTRERLSAVDISGFLGCGIQRLADQLSLPLETPNDGANTDLAGQIQNRLQAWIRLDARADPVAIGGDDRVIDYLGAFFALNAGQIQQQLPEPPHAGLLLLSEGGPKADALMCLRTADLWMIGTLPPGDLPAVLQSWQSAQA